MSVSKRVLSKTWSHVKEAQVLYRHKSNYAEDGKVCTREAKEIENLYCSQYRLI